MSDELDELLKELQKENGSTLSISQSAVKKQKTERVKITDDNINEFVLTQAAKLVESGMDSVDAIKDYVLQSADYKEVESYASLLKAVTDSIDTINKINLQNKKDKTAKELQEMKGDAQKQIGPAQTNVLIATREEIMSKMFEEAKVENVIEAEYEEKEDDE